MGIITNLLALLKRFAVEHVSCLVCFLNDRFYCGYLFNILSRYFVFPSLCPFPPETFPKAKILVSQFKGSHPEGLSHVFLFVCLFFKMMVVMTDSDWFILRTMRIFMSNLLFCFQPYYVHTLFKVYPDWQGRPNASLSVSPSFLELTVLWDLL